MKKITGKLVIIFFLMCYSCKDEKANITNLTLIAEEYDKRRSSHQLYEEIYDVLNKCISSDEIKSDVKSKGEVSFDCGNSNIVINNKKITSINQGSTFYEFSDSTDVIKVKYKTKSDTKIGTLRASTYNGFYLTQSENTYALTELQDNDTISRKKYYKKTDSPYIISNYKGNKKEGEFIQFYETGKEAIKCSFIKGELDGLMSEWYESGDLKTKVEYTNGKKTGEQIVYYDNRKTMKLKTNYVNGKKEGVELSWFSNTKIKYKINYKKGLLDGEAIIYHESNSYMNLKGNYTEDLKNGLFNLWNVQGEIFFSSEYSFNERKNIKKGNNDDELKLVDLEDLFFEEF